MSNKLFVCSFDDDWFLVVANVVANVKTFVPEVSVNSLVASMLLILLYIEDKQNSQLRLIESVCVYVSIHLERQ